MGGAAQSAPPHPLETAEGATLDRVKHLKDQLGPRVSEEMRSLSQKGQFRPHVIDKM